MPEISQKAGETSLMNIFSSAVNVGLSWL